MSYRVHTAMHHMQPSAFHPMPDGPRSDPEGNELRPTHEPMLALRERRDEGVNQ